MRAASAVLLLAVSLPLFAATFTVQSTDDDGFGSLRWAIQQANETAGRDVIDFATPRMTIVLVKALPFILDPADIDGKLVTIDAHAVTDGLTITADDVVVRYVTIIGAKRAAFRVLGDRAEITDSIVRNSGFGFHLLGDAATLGAVPFQCSFDPCPVLPLGNTAEENGLGIFVEGNDNSIIGNRADGSDQYGILVKGARNKLESNSTSNNLWNGVGVEKNNSVALHTGTCNGQDLIAAAGSDAVPQLTSVIADGNLVTVEGTLHGDPLQAYAIRLVAPNGGHCDAHTASSITPIIPWLTVDTIPVTTDANGDATFRAARWAPAAEAVAAWSQKLNGSETPSTSDISSTVPVERNAHPSADLQLSTTVTRPSPAVLTFNIAVKNEGPSAVQTIVDIPRPAGTVFTGFRLIGSEHPFTCWLSGIEFCAVTLLAGETQVIEHTVRITGSANTIVHRATIYPADGVPDPDPSDNTFAVSVPLRVRSRAVGK